MSSIAEQERLTLRQRQSEGIEVAKAKGKHLGRPPVQYPENWMDVYNQWKDGLITAKIAMDTLDMKRTTFYKLVKQYEEKEDNTYER